MVRSSVVVDWGITLLANLGCLRLCTESRRSENKFLWSQLGRQRTLPILLSNPSSNRLDRPEEPHEQPREEQAAHRELEPDGSLRRREEALQAAGDNQHGNDAGDQAGSLDAAAGPRTPPAQGAGEEHGVAQAEARAARNDDRR